MSAQHRGPKGLYCAVSFYVLCSMFYVLWNSEASHLGIVKSCANHCAETIAHPSAVYIQAKYSGKLWRLTGK